MLEVSGTDRNAKPLKLCLHAVVSCALYCRRETQSVATLNNLHPALELQILSLTAPNSAAAEF